MPKPHPHGGGGDTPKFGPVPRGDRLVPLTADSAGWDSHSFRQVLPGVNGEEISQAPVINANYRAATWESLLFPRCPSKNGSLQVWHRPSPVIRRCCTAGKVKIWEAGAVGTAWWGRVPEVPKVPEGTQLLALAGGRAHATPGEGNPWGKMVFSSLPPPKKCAILEIRGGGAGLAEPSSRPSCDGMEKTSPAPKTWLGQGEVARR